MTTISKLTATPKERKNIGLILGYLIGIMGSPLARKYDHGDLKTCTIGYALRSNLFPVLNANIEEDDGYLQVKDGSKFEIIEHVITEVFGADYRRHIVFGDGSRHVSAFNEGDEQLHAVIEYIKAAFKIKATVIINAETATEQKDPTKTKILNRIKVLNDFIRSSEALGDDYRSALTVVLVNAHEEIEALEKVLKL